MTAADAVCEWAGCDRPATRGATCLLHTERSQEMLRAARARNERADAIEAALRALVAAVSDADDPVTAREDAALLAARALLSDRSEP